MAIMLIMLIIMAFAITKIGELLIIMKMIVILFLDCHLVILSLSSTCTSLTVYSLMHSFTQIEAFFQFISSSLSLASTIHYATLDFVDI